MPRSPDRLAAEPAGVQPRIGLVVDRLDWQAREFAKAFAALGTRIVPVKLPLSGVATQNLYGLSIDGFAGGLPDAVIVRSISGGTFEAVTLRLGILHALRELGVLVCNDGRAIERCVDKSMTSFLLARAGIPTPATWATETKEAARTIVRRELAQGPLVLKPLFGSQGRGLRLIRTMNDLPDPDSVAGVYYLQRFVAVEGDGFRDFRLLVSQGRVIAAMVRHSAAWITNLKQGGRPIAAVADAEMKALAVRATTAVGADFAGVDIVHGADGRAMVLEVNSMPAWSGLQKVTTANIASIIAADVMAALDALRRREAAG